MGLFGEGLGVFGQWLGAKRNVKNAEDTKKANLAIAKELDYTPEYASDYVPAYKRSESPIARSYLESMLVGNNPSSVSSTAPGAAVKKSMLQGQQNRMFGTPEERVLRARQVDQEQPWKVKTPTRDPKGTQAQQASANWTAENKPYAQRGINKNLYDAIESAGMEMGHTKGDEIAGSGFFGALQAEQLIKKYGSADAAAAAVRKRGRDA